MLMFCVKNLSTRFANFDKTWFCGICSNIYWGSISFWPSDHTYMDHMCQTLPFFGNSKIKLANMGVPWNDRRPKLLLDKSLLEWWFNIKQFFGGSVHGCFTSFCDWFVPEGGWDLWSQLANKCFLVVHNFDHIYNFEVVGWWECLPRIWSRVRVGSGHCRVDVHC